MSKTFASIKAGLNQALAHAGARSDANSNTNELKITKGSRNVFLDIGFPPEEAENLLLRAKLVTRIASIIEERNFSSRAAAKFFDLTESQLKKLLRGETRTLTIDSLVGMLARAGIAIEPKFVKAKTAAAA